MDDIKFINGLWQTRCNSLAPTGFDWTDNGINMADQETIRSGMYFAFNCLGAKDNNLL